MSLNVCLARKHSKPFDVANYCEQFLNKAHWISTHIIHRTRPPQIFFLSNSHFRPIVICPIAKSLILQLIVRWCKMHDTDWYAWGHFKKVYNPLALKCSLVNKMHIFQCMGKFHTKCLTHTLKDTVFIQRWNFKSSRISELTSVFEMPPPEKCRSHKAIFLLKHNFKMKYFLIPNDTWSET